MVADDDAFTLPPTCHHLVARPAACLPPPHTHYAHTPPFARTPYTGSPLRALPAATHLPHAYNTRITNAHAGLRCRYRLPTIPQPAYLRRTTYPHLFLPYHPGSPFLLRSSSPASLHSCCLPPAAFTPFLCLPVLPDTNPTSPIDVNNTFINPSDEPAPPYFGTLGLVSVPCHFTCN